MRYAELTCTPHTSVLAGVPIEAYTEAIEDARASAERDFGIVLRWIYDIPGELGVPGADATLGYVARPRARLADRPRARRSRDRRAAAAVQAALRRRPRRRAAQRSRTRGRRPGRRRSGTRCATSAPSGSATAPPSAQDPALLAHLAEHRIPLEVCPSLQHRHPGGRHARGAPAARLPRRRRRGHDQQRRPADVRHHARTGSTRSPPTCSTSTRPASPTSPARPCRSPSPPTT